MIQNLQNKMESQINTLETKIDKMQEMFNKDLEEIKKSQLKMNNAEPIIQSEVSQKDKEHYNILTHIYGI